MLHTFNFIYTQILMMLQDDCNYLNRWNPWNSWNPWNPLHYFIYEKRYPVKNEVILKRIYVGLLTNDLR